MTELQKHPSEHFYISVDFAASLDAGDTLDAQNCLVKAYNADDTENTAVVDSNKFTVIDTRLLAYVQAGSDGEDYRLRFLAATTNGDLFQKNIELQVKETD